MNESTRYLCNISEFDAQATKVELPKIPSSVYKDWPGVQMRLTISKKDYLVYPMPKGALQ